MTETRKRRLMTYGISSAASVLSVAGILVALNVIGSKLFVRWESVAGRTYFLERSATASSGFTPLAPGIPGQPCTTSYTDTNAIGTGPWFYRVGVSSP